MQNADENQFEWINFDVSDVKRGSGRKDDIPILLRNIQSKKRKFKINIKVNFEEKDSLIEWFLTLDMGKAKDFTFSPSDNPPINEEVELDAHQTKKIILTVTTPKGGYMGDKATLTVKVDSEDGIHSLTRTFSVTISPIIVALKTTVGNEIPVSRDLVNRAQRDKEERMETNPNAISEILAVMSPFEVKGYVFVEAMHSDRIAYIARGIRGFKGIVQGDIDLEEIVHYLTPKPAVTGLEIGAFVELIDGPFKGEKAKITFIDAGKEEVTVQLIESMVPIPVTVKAEAIRMLDKK